MKKLLESIKDTILKNEHIQSCLIYPHSRSEIVAPAVFLEIANYESGDDPATGELSLIANIEARIVIDATIENVELVCLPPPQFNDLYKIVYTSEVFSKFGS